MIVASPVVTECQTTHEPNLKHQRGIKIVSFYRDNTRNKISKEDSGDEIDI